MEHRVGHRSRCRLSVVLRLRDGRSIVGEILDISAGGAFIRIIDPAATPRGLLKLEFQMPDARHCEWWSLVVRESLDGIGVMFDQRHNETAACRMRPRTDASAHTLRA